MEKDKLLKRVLMMQRLQGMETEPISAEDPYASMEKDQLISMIHFLVKREDERAQENQELKDMVKELRDTHKQDVKTQASLLKTQSNLMKSIDNLTNQVSDLTTQNKSLQHKVNDLLSQISVGNKVRFGSKSQKGIKKNAVPVQDREKDKDDFDGTNGTAMSSTFQADAATVDAETEPAEQSQKSYENRKGLKYQTMNADRREIHESDRNLLPEGATYLWSEYKSSYDQVSYIVQHDYEIIVYKDKNGKMCCGYFPKADEPSVIDCFPGTHASSSLLANLVFNKYHMNTPVYREMVRLLNNRMNMSRNTVYNWFVKGSKHLNKVLPVLKEKLLAKGAVVNCDETWCRVKIKGKYGKKYIWCMVNKEAKVAVYFYDDGSRGRKVLRDFLGETKIDALQSDGFRSSLSRLLPKGRKNVYMYLDNELVDVDHLCCFAHARAKFQYAFEQGKDADAEYFIRLIGWLYDQEEQYRLRHLTPEQIRKERQGEKTSKIISQIRQRLDKLLADGNGMRGDLMQKALNYLNSFWNQLILYLKDGRYNIDRSALPLGSSKNSLAERTLRPMTVERKNSLTFGSHAGAKVSVIYHTFIETCKMCGVSTLEYFKEFFKAIMQGRKDYENMLPMTIGIKK